MVDAARVRALLGRIHDRRARLEAYASLDLHEFLQDEKGVLACKYLLLTLIEDVLGLANHIIASEGYRSPHDYADAFRVLAERGVVERPLGERLEAMARFRNLLVHVYATVDDARVYGFVQEDLKDVESFTASVLRTFGELESQSG